MSTKRTRVAACFGAAVAIAAAAIAVIGVTATPRATADPCGNWRTNSSKLVLNLANGQTANFALSRPNAFSPNFHSSNLETGGDGLHDFYAQAITGVPVEGKTVDFTVSWSDLDGTDITSHFTGSVGDDGVARGTAVDNKNFQVDWTSQGALSCADQATPPGVAPPPYLGPVNCPDGSTVTSPATCPVAAAAKNCPDGTSVPAGQPCVPPSDAVAVKFARSGLDLKATFTNSSKASGTCHYDAEPAGGTAIGNKVDDFPIGAGKDVTRTYPGPLMGSTYHVVVSCTGTYDGQNVEFGHIDQNFDF
jgi:hypothetical protein